MDAERVTGLLAAMEVFSSLHGQFDKCIERLERISQHDIVLSLERGEEYQVHRASVGAKKISEALDVFCEKAPIVTRAFSTVLDFLHEQLNEAQGTPGLDLRQSDDDADAEDFL